MRILTLIAATFLLAAQAPTQTTTGRIRNGTAGTTVASDSTGNVTSQGGSGFISATGLSSVTASGTIMLADGSATWQLVGGTPLENRKPSAKAPTLSQVKHSATLLAKHSLPDGDYVRLARSVGLESAGVDEARLMTAIDKLGFEVFEFAKVDEWLYNQALKEGTNVRWVWKPLRESDKKASSDVATWRVVAGMGFLYPELYAQRVPAEVLGKVASALKEIPDAVFLVSDYEVIKPDPFLAFTTQKLLRAGKIWIIAQWDEPGFGAPAKKNPEVRPVSELIAQNRAQAFVPSSLTIEGTRDNPGRLSAESGDLKISTLPTGELLLQGGSASAR